MCQICDKRKIFIALLCLAMIFALSVPAVGEQSGSFEVGAKAAVVIDAATGRVLFAQNEHKQLPMASTTKIMTSLLALEQEGAEEMFEVDPLAIKVEGSSMGLREGDLVSLHALAVGMLLHSGNDAANATAVRISGNIPEFAALMNERAQSIGMTNSSFETPSGLDGENHYSTAYDMALLAREAIANEAFVGICSQYKLRTSFGNPPHNRWLKNHNRLLSSYDGAFGVKTGFTKKSGRCLVSAARRDGVELICVTLGCPDDWSTHKNLYDRFFAQLTVQDLAQGLEGSSVPVVGGTASQVRALPIDQANAAIPEDGPEIRYQLRLPSFVYAPVNEGQYLGEADIFLGDEKLFTLPLAAGENIPLLYPEKKGLLDKVADWLG
ncbi:MAG: D-alanyl-D-alanine carboxypeptidase [Oscillospiraceae bacterium]|nr:D-alanyl-D-alanine carboxypeptidase [Oscillospiraceae bacterium]